MKPTKKFMKYLKQELPEGYYARCSPDSKKITIFNGEGYVYLFHKQEIEEDFELCCSVVNAIIDLTKKQFEEWGT